MALQSCETAAIHKSMYGLFPVITEITRRQLLLVTETLFIILAANTCMNDSFCKIMDVSGSCNDRKLAKVL